MTDARIQEEVRSVIRSMSAFGRTRRELLGASLVLPATVALARWEGVILGAAPAAAGPLLPPTPECNDDGPTPSTTAGPFYKPVSPLRTSLLEPGVTGTRVVLSGRVLSTDCRPVPRASSTSGTRTAAATTTTRATACAATSSPTRRVATAW